MRQTDVLLCALFAQSLRSYFCAKNTQSKPPLRKALCIKEDMKNYLSLICLSLLGCGDIDRDSAVAYAEAATVSLIEKGICASREECSKNGYIFWEGASLLGDKVHINLYKTDDAEVISAVQEAIFSARSERDAGVILTVYSSEHGTKRVRLFQGTWE
ncbi:hypothetical protein [Microbulbifer sp. Q7]|uniref:hypothetical protein n=1 Tax=Microbulbifer sp. Q7 TaxID=1785091 RepID=UPI0008360699|nr:hypothetical protein [Microbulbifer sp. Q7]